MKYMKSFESYNDQLNEGLELNPELKAKVQAYVNQNLSTLQKALAPFRGKSQEQVQGILGGGSNEGFSDFIGKIRRGLATAFNWAAVGGGAASLISCLIGLAQLGIGGEGSAVPITMTGGMIGLVAAIFVYAIGLVFKGSGGAAPTAHNDVQPTA